METKGGEAVLLLSASLALVVVIAAVIIGLIGLNVDTPAGGCCQKVRRPSRVCVWGG